jgi:hypothetical protein
VVQVQWCGKTATAKEGYIMMAVASSYLAVFWQTTTFGLFWSKVPTDSQKHRSFSKVFIHAYHSSYVWLCRFCCFKQDAIANRYYDIIALNAVVEQGQSIFERSKLRVG